MDDKPPISFDLPGIGRVIVDSVPIEGDGRIAEQHGGISRHLARGLADWRGVARLGCTPGFGPGFGWGVAVDDILAFAHHQLAGRAVFMHHRDKAQSAGAALFHLDIFDAGCAGDHLVNDQRGDEGDLAASPHASGKGHRRQETTAPGVTVIAKPACRGDRLGKTEMHHQRGLGPGIRRRIAVKCRVETGDKVRRQPFGHGLGLADPATQVLDIKVHVWSLRQARMIAACQAHARRHS